MFALISKRCCRPHDKFGRQTSHPVVTETQKLEGRRCDNNMAIKSCGSDNHGISVREPSLGHCPMVLGRSLDLRWMEKVAGGGIEVGD